MDIKGSELAEAAGALRMKREQNSAQRASLSLLETAEIVDFLRTWFLAGFEAASQISNFEDRSATAIECRVAISTASRILAELALSVEDLFPVTAPPIEFTKQPAPLPVGSGSLGDIVTFVRFVVLDGCLEKLSEIERRGSYFQDANLMSFARFARLALGDCVELLDGVAKIAL